jgi:endonuclease/exonuclease/phosphatase family metal-dependent hydrolase
MKIMHALRLLSVITTAGSLFVGCQSARVQDPNTATIGTFNIEWLGDGKDDQKPRTEEEYRRIADVIDRTQADVLGVQEIESQEALDRVLKYLPDYKGVVYNAGIPQNVGVVYRHGEISVTPVGPYMPLTVGRNRMRPGFVVSCKKGSVDWTMMVVHLKSTSRMDSTDALREESRLIRGKQVAMLRSWSDSVVKSTDEKDVVIVGDFNDFTGRRSEQATLTPLINSSEMSFLTGSLRSCKNPNWYVIDHVVVSRTMKDRMVVSSERVDDTRAFLSPDAASAVSDHCPVTVRFLTQTP